MGGIHKSISGTKNVNFFTKLDMHLKALIVTHFETKIHPGPYQKKCALI
jgi:hypothetical protein